MANTTKTQEGLLGTAEFAALPPDDGWRFELARGRLEREPAPGLRHAHVASRIAALLREWGEARGMGWVLPEAGFELARDPPTVRVPDVAFLRTERVPNGVLPEGFGQGAPDLAVEIVSPSNRMSHVQGKALEYLDAGAAAVWVVDPARRTVTVYRSRSDIRILEVADTLTVPDVIPELEIQVHALFGDP